MQKFAQQHQELRQTQEKIAQFSTMLEKQLAGVSQLQEQISDHIEKGDLNNQETNSLLWHDLNNYEHRLINIAYMLGRQIQTCDNLVKDYCSGLRALRPPKEKKSS